MKKSAWLAFFDGGCGPMNPGGHATAGGAIFRDDVLEKEISKYLGVGHAFSNNVAEYCALIEVVEFLREAVSPGDSVSIRGDSDLVVKQMTGRWRAKRGLYLPHHRRCKTAWLELLRVVPIVDLRWVPREQNQLADALANAAFPPREWRDNSEAEVSSYDIAFRKGD